VLLLLVPLAQAMQWTCAGGDTACLRAAMTAANTAPGTYAEHVIVLGPGIFTFTTPDPSAPTGDTALPLVTGGMTILGAGLQTELMRAIGGSARIRLFEVAAGGTLVLADVAVEGGNAFAGAGLKNNGTLALYRTVVRWNTGTAIWSSGVLGMIGANIYGNGGQLNTAAGLDIAGGYAVVQDSFIWWNLAGAEGDGGGILVRRGSLTLRGSTVSHNVTGGGGGGIDNGAFGDHGPGGEVLIDRSFIGLNVSGGATGISNRGVMEIVNSTLANERMAECCTGTMLVNGSSATLFLTNSTLVHQPQGDGPGTPPPGTVLRNLGGILSGDEGLVLLQNTLIWGTIVAGRPGGQDCQGSVISLGNNLLGDPTGCAIALQPTDRTGDPGLGAFVDVQVPGHSYFPLLPTSQGRGAANPAVCPQVDQIGTPRDVVCDIGAIERFEGTGGVAQR
jgi:hypothetical protein